MAYTKLFNSIVTSTIWTESDRTRIVWITMLACADKNGEVHASVPGLARVAAVPVDDCRAAIECFLSPDPDSRTKDDEGRRIEVIDGGWSLLNFRKYRQMASKEEAQEGEAKRKARYRARIARNVPNVPNVPECPTSVPGVSTVGKDIAEAEAKADSEAEAETEKKRAEKIPPAAGADKPRAVRKPSEAQKLWLDAWTLNRPEAPAWVLTDVDAKILNKRGKDFGMELLAAKIAALHAMPDQWVQDNLSPEILAKRWNNLGAKAPQVAGQTEAVKRMRQQTAGAQSEWGDYLTSQAQPRRLTQ